MTDETKLKYLRISLILFGLVLIVAIYPFFQFWPSGWRWGAGHPSYEQMIVGIYATLGIFMILAAKDPSRHLSLIWFTVWSSLMHAGIMTVQALVAENEMGHMLGDIPALVLIALVLAWLTPRRA